MENVQSDLFMKKEMSKHSLEVEGADIEDAIKRALDVLKVSRDEIIIKVVCEEKKGLFGMEGAKPAKIKVTLKKIK
jgi:spoIIIJ-associated protein